MAYFLKSGNTYKVSAKEALDIHEILPAGNYVIKQDMFKNFYLEEIDNFEIKGKIYGETIRNTQRILSTFLDRTSSTGVMLTGEKGSGKTLLAKMITVEAAKQGIPTIVINASWCGDNFNSFIQNIDQPCIILFDEFEKTYDREEQESILTLLDGVFPSKKLFVLTCNDKWRVDQHMRNRPGRIYYMLDFKGLEQDFIIEYCEDNLKVKSHIAGICKIAMMFDQFNFDMLKALVEEMNRYGETPQEALKMLNAKPEFSNDSRFKVHLNVRGVEIPEEKLEMQEWSGNPLGRQLSLEYRGDEDDEGDWNWETCKFEQSDLKHIDPNQGKFVFINNIGCKVTLSRIKEKDFNYYSF